MRKPIRMILMSLCIVLGFAPDGNTDSVVLSAVVAGAGSGGVKIVDQGFVRGALWFTPSTNQLNVFSIDPNGRLISYVAFIQDAICYPGYVLASMNLSKNIGDMNKVLVSIEGVSKPNAQNGCPNVGSLPILLYKVENSSRVQIMIPLFYCVNIVYVDFAFSFTVLELQ